MVRLRLVFFTIGLLIASGLLAQNNTYTSRYSFGASAPCVVTMDNFEDYDDSLEMNTSFTGKAAFTHPKPKIFKGEWGLKGTQGAFLGKALLPQPPFSGSPLGMDFNSPVFGVGANVFDDFDGVPEVNTITLTVTTGQGEVISISEMVNTAGDCGFIGITSAYGIVEAVFSIDNQINSNFEVDMLSIIPICPEMDAV